MFPIPTSSCLLVSELQHVACYYLGLQGMGKRCWSVLLTITFNHIRLCFVLNNNGSFFYKAKAVAAESNATFFNISAASLTSKYVRAHSCVYVEDQGSVALR